MRQIVIALALALAVGLAGPAAPARADQHAEAIRTLAEQGDAKAQFALGSMYRDARGVDRDYAQALGWWEKAAEQGLVDAQYALGNIYSGGTGVARDNVLSYMWYDIAAAQTGAGWLAAIAGTNRDVLVKRMTKADLAKAKQLAADWLAEHGK
jgi:TPR repeat protein